MVNIEKCFEGDNTVLRKREILDTPYIRLYALGLIVAFANTLFFANQIVAYSFVAFEVVILIINFIKKDVISYLGHYILFCGLSLEFDSLVGGTIYSFKEFHVGGINLGVLALVPVFLLSINRVISVGTIKRESPNLAKFSYRYLIVIISSLLIGMILYALNDNGVQQLGFGIIVEELYQRGFQPLLMIGTVIFAMQKDPDSIERLSKYLEVTLISVVFEMIISLLSGMQGIYGGVTTLLSSVNLRWVPLLLLFPLYDRYKGRMGIIIFGIIGMVLSLLFNATGKMIIAYVLIPAIYIAFHIMRHEYKKVLLWIVIIPVFIFALFPVAAYLSDFSVLFNSKLNQVISLLSFFGRKTSMENMMTSPRTRIYEIWVTLQEYLLKPYLFPLGKGLGGTVFANQIPYDRSAYSEIEMNVGLVYNMHESFAKLFLSNGLYGVFFLLSTVIHGLRKFSKSPWILIGVYWFALSFGYSITMTSFGLGALLYGIYECDRKDNA